MTEENAAPLATAANKPTFGAYVVLALIAVGVVMCAMPRKDEPKLANGLTESQNLVAARLAVEERLKDPDSAKFDVLYTSEKAGIVVVCGTVNAKNGFGGYAGEEEFIFAGQAAVLQSDLPPAQFAMMRRQSC